jgi:dienelactone hydrolase
MFRFKSHMNSARNECAMVGRAGAKSKSPFVALGMAFLPLALTHAQADSLADGRVGRIEFQSINTPDLWQFARKNLQNTKAQTVWGDLLMPKTVAIDRKVPALVIMHGSGGVEPFAYDVWGSRLNAAGAAVFVVDSYKPRGVESTATSQNEGNVTVASQTADALNALRVLASHPHIDPNRIFVIGMSRGGNPAFYSAWPMYQAPVDTKGAKYSGHIAMYPGMCNVRYRADANGESKATAPIFFALPDRAREDWQDVAVCERFAKELAALGNPVTIKEYAGTYHAWDGGNRPFRYLADAHSAKPCDMELQMTNVLGSGLGKSARDLKTSRAIAGFDDWLKTISACMTHTRARIGGDSGKTDEVVADVLKFMGIK